jgi:hypothetical protein
MDCMASKAATKNGLVLSSLPAASGMLVLFASRDDRM